MFHTPTPMGASCEEDKASTLPCGGAVTPARACASAAGQADDVGLGSDLAVLVFTSQDTVASLKGSV